MENLSESLSSLICDNPTIAINILKHPQGMKFLKDTGISIDSLANVQASVCYYLVDKGLLPPENLRAPDA